MAPGAKTDPRCALAHRRPARPGTDARVREPGNKTGQMAGHNRRYLAASVRNTGYLRCPGKGELHSVSRSDIRRDIPVVCASVDCLWHRAVRRAQSTIGARLGYGVRATTATRAKDS